MSAGRHERREDRKRIPDGIRGLLHCYESGKPSAETAACLGMRDLEVELWYTRFSLEEVRAELSRSVRR